MAPDDPQDPDSDAREDAAWEEASEEPQPYYEAPPDAPTESYYQEAPALDLEKPGRGRVVAGIVLALVSGLWMLVVMVGVSQDWMGKGETWAYLEVTSWAIIVAGLLILAAVLILTGLGGIARAGPARAAVVGKKEEEVTAEPAEPPAEGWTPSRPESAFHAYKPAYVTRSEGGRQRLVFTYPEIARGGIFGDVDVDLGGEKVLKVRSRLVRPCTLCEERFVCWKEYKDRLTEEVFYSNYNCRPGLARLAAEATAPARGA